MVDLNKRHFFAILAVLAVSVILRVGVAMYLGDSIQDIRGGTADQLSYDALARRVVDGYGFSFDRQWWPYAKANEPTAFWSFGYTTYLAGVYSVVGHHPLAARILQAVIVGILTPWFLYRIGRRSFNRRTGLIAAAISAVYLYFILYAGSLMTEALYIVGVLWTVDVAMRIAGETAGSVDSGGNHRLSRNLLHGLELGLAIGFAILLRQVILVFLIALVGWLVWVGWRRKGLGPVVVSVAVAGLVALLFLSPVLVRNYRVFDRIMMPNTNSGFSFFWANHPIYGTRFVPVLTSDYGVSYQDLIPPELRHLDEATLDRALLGRSLQGIQSSPGRYILLTLSRIPVFFLFWPTAQSTMLSNLARILSFGLFLPFMVYGLFLTVRGLYWPKEANQPAENGRAHLSSGDNLTSEYQLLLLIFIILYTTIHLASWANVRYRLPVDAVLIIFAAYGIDKIARLISVYRRDRAHSHLQPTASGG